MATRMERVLLLGCGYLGLALLARARSRALEVIATTRQPERADELRAHGARAVVLPSLSVEALAEHVDAATGLVVSVPPDGHTDQACRGLAERAFAAVYVSSTGVYGEQRGHIDDSTPAAPDTPRTWARLEAERVWREAGATVLRPAAIYGPGRGMHTRVRDGSARIAGDGSQHICRIHVSDLAEATLRCLELRLARETYVAADDEPAPQREVVQWLAQRLGVPAPASVPLDAAAETLRHDRRVDASRLKAHTGLSWSYPSYREGFEACLRAEDPDRLT